MARSWAHRHPGSQRVSSMVARLHLVACLQAGPLPVRLAQDLGTQPAEGLGVQPAKAGKEGDKRSEWSAHREIRPLC